METILPLDLWKKFAPFLNPLEMSEQETIPFIEVYQPKTNKSCILPQKTNLEMIMQDFHRNYHTQTNLLSCGGGNLDISDNHFEEVYYVNLNMTLNLSMPLTCILYLPGKGYIHAYDLQGRVHLYFSPNPRKIKY